jgi:hypothetical protein
MLGVGCPTVATNYYMYPAIKTTNKIKTLQYGYSKLASKIFD